MKYLKFFVASVFSIAVMASCSSTTTEKVENEADTLAGKVENAVDKLESKVDSMGKGEDKDFVRDAVEANEKELKILADGQKLGTSKELKDAAKKMAADHEKLGKQMKDYASKKNITLDQDAHEMNHDIDGKKGTEWDKNWVDHMVEMHEKDVKDFEDAMDDVDDMELKTMISDALPVLRAHLDMAKALQARMSK